MEKIGCIIVLYNPDNIVLERNINAILGQVDLVYLVDNSSTSRKDEFESISPKILYKGLSKNIGIASAQNIAIRFFMEKSFDYILFMDQDSLPPENLIAQYLSDIQILHDNNIIFGGIASLAINSQNNRPYLTRLPENSVAKYLTEVKTILNSSSFIPVANFEKCGLMEEGLFIDGVDYEWCWRATYKFGAKFFITKNALLIHQLGNGDKNFFNISTATPSPFRTYFQFRNFLYFVRRKYVPIKWKIKNGLKYLLKSLYYPLFVPPRREYVKNIFSGIKHGLKPNTNFENYLAEKI